MNFSMTQVAVIFSTLLIVACSTPVDDLLNNNFSEVVAKPVKDQYIGVWTGSTGPWLTTMAIRKNGTGIYCSSWAQRNFIGNLKVADEVINYQDGAKLQIALVDGALAGGYVGNSLGNSGAKYKFMRDPELKEASPYCNAEMSR